MIAITKLVSAAGDRRHIEACQFREVAHGRNNTITLEFKLVIVRYVLPLATGAIKEIATWSVGPVLAGDNHLSHPGVNHLRVDPHDLATDILTCQAAHHPDRSAFEFSGRTAIVPVIAEFKLQQVTLRNPKVRSQVRPAIALASLTLAQTQPVSTTIEE